MFSLISSVQVNGFSCSKKIPVTVFVSIRIRAVFVFDIIRIRIRIQDIRIRICIREKKYEKNMAESLFVRIRSVLTPT